MCLFFVSFSMAYRAIRVPAYICPLYQESRRNRAYLTIRYDPIAIGTFEFVRKPAPCFRFMLHASSFRPSSRDADSIGRYGEAAGRYAWRAAGRNETEWKNGTPTGESNYTGTTFLPVWRVEGRGERTPATPVTCLQCQSLFLCSFCDFRIYQSHCLYNRRYGKTIFD